MTRPSFVILTDNPNSWSLPGSRLLVEKLRADGFDAELVHDLASARDSTVAVFLSCERIIRSHERVRFQHNLVVHASDLPRGRGWSPLTWQVLDGASEIVVTLFEAVDEVDAGPIYAQLRLPLGGHELIDELRTLVDQATATLIMQFAHDWPNVQARPQVGDPTFFPRRRPVDSKLDPEKPLLESFNLLRVVDNHRYPAYFEHAGHIYELRITKRGPS